MAIDEPLLEGGFAAVAALDRIQRLAKHKGRDRRTMEHPVQIGQLTRLS